MTIWKDDGKYLELYTDRKEAVRISVDDQRRVVRLKLTMKELELLKEAVDKTLKTMRGY